MTAAGSAAALTPAAFESGRAAWTRASLAFTVFALAACALLWPTLAGMAGTWIASSTYHHGVLVAPIALWMILQAGAPLFAPRPSFAFLPGVVAAALVWLAGRAAGVNLVAEIGFVSLLIAGAGVAFGAPSVRRWAFPLAFLYFMVPFGSALLPGLQSFAAHSVATLLTASGVETSVDGVLIATPTQRYLIAEACAGLNFLLAASMVAAIYSWMAFRGWRKVAAFFAFALVLALAANILRAYSVILFETWTGGELGIAENHILFGWAFYGVLLFALVLIGNRFADAPIRRAAPVQVNARAARGAGAVLIAIAIVAATAGYARFVVERAPAFSLPTSLPLINVPGWRVVEPSPEWRASGARADRTLFARYQSEARSVDLAAAYFAYERPQAEIAGFASRAFGGRDWRRLGAHETVMVALGAPRTVRIDSLENAAGARLDAVTLYWLGGEIFTDPAALKLRLAAEKLQGRSRRGGALIVATAAVDGTEAERVLRAFLQSVEPIDEWLARIDAKLSN